MFQSQQQCTIWHYVFLSKLYFCEKIPWLLTNLLLRTRQFYYQIIITSSKSCLFICWSISMPVRPVGTVFKKFLFLSVLLDAKRQCLEDDTPCNNNFCIEVDGKCVHDCSNLPHSMNSNREEKGCFGAVNIYGQAQETYCTGRSFNENSVVYPWWSACCHWDNNQCKPIS